MNEKATDLDGRVTAGRKGVPYDWQAVLADDTARADDTALVGAAAAFGSRQEPAMVALVAL